MICRLQSPAQSRPLRACPHFATTRYDDKRKDSRPDNCGMDGHGQSLSPMMLNGTLDRYSNREDATCWRLYFVFCVLCLFLVVLCLQMFLVHCSYVYYGRCEDERPETRP